MASSRLCDVPVTTLELGHIPGFWSVQVVGLERAIQAVLRDAEIKALVNKHLLEDARQCVKWARRYKKRTPQEKLTVEQCAAIHMYTLEYCGDDGRLNFYQVFNSYMAQPNRPRLKPFLPYLRLLSSALTALPRVGKCTLYRGIKKPLEELSSYQDDAEFAWWGMSSCSRNANKVQHFAGDQGTVFSVKCRSAVDVDAYSMCRGEEELLLLPGTVFSVVHRLPKMAADTVGRVVVQEEEPSFLWAHNIEDEKKALEDLAPGRAEFELGMKCGRWADKERHLLAAHQLGYAPAAVALALLYHHTNNLTKQKEYIAQIDVSALKAMADSKDPNAIDQLGLCHLNGWGVSRDLKEAARLYRLAADQGQANAQYNLGVCFKNGYGVGKDLKEAVRLYRLAADQGDDKAQYNLGECFRNGYGVGKDLKEAVRLYRLAADQGGAKAQYNLGVSFANGDGVGKDLKQAVRLYRLAADQGHAQAQYSLGWCFENGDGVGKDLKEAVRLYRLAADQGYAKAQYNLGVCFERGDGVGKDLKEAVRLYRLAADQGDANAQFNLAFCFANGDGVAKDLKEAVRLYRLAADQGYADAQYNLGVSFERGDDGVVKDLKEAVRFYRLAADQGDAEAKQKAQQLEESL